MSDLPAYLAETLKRHQFWHANHSSIGSNAHCLCGLRPRDQSEWANHLADVLLSLPGIAIVELPEARPDWHGGLSAWPAGGRDGQVTIRKTDGRIGATSVSNPLASPRDARTYAAALLAAANAAEAAS